jgi:hypothetical protein
MRQVSTTLPPADECLPPECWTHCRALSSLWLCALAAPPRRAARSPLPRHMSPRATSGHSTVPTSPPRATSGHSTVPTSPPRATSGHSTLPTSPPRATPGHSTVPTSPPRATSGHSTLPTSPPRATPGHSTVPTSPPRATSGHSTLARHRVGGPLAMRPTAQERSNGCRVFSDVSNRLFQLSFFPLRG